MKKTLIKKFESNQQASSYYDMVYYIINQEPGVKVCLTDVEVVIMGDAEKVEQLKKLIPR